MLIINRIHLGQVVLARSLATSFTAQQSVLTPSVASYRGARGIVSNGLMKPNSSNFHEQHPGRLPRASRVFYPLFRRGPVAIQCTAASSDP
jgi:hypothetical protein